MSSTTTAIGMGVLECDEKIRILKVMRDGN